MKKSIIEKYETDVAFNVTVRSIRRMLDDVGHKDLLDAACLAVYLDAQEHVHRSFR